MLAKILGHTGLENPLKGLTSILTRFINTLTGHTSTLTTSAW